MLYSRRCFMLWLHSASLHLSWPNELLQCSYSRLVTTLYELSRKHTSAQGTPRQAKAHWIWMALCAAICLPLPKNSCTFSLARLNINTRYKQPHHILGFGSLWWTDSEWIEARSAWGKSSQLAAAQCAIDTCAQNSGSDHSDFYERFKSKIDH